MIHFVGAGCGAADLITVRGMRLLQQADIVVYTGSLISPALLEYTKPECIHYNSAKMHFDSVMEVLIQGHRGNREVVRLHTGDLSIYSAIAEQLFQLEQKKIPYEICPGVGAAAGAAAALHSEYTQPEVSQTVIFTRMAGRTPVPERERISALAAHGATMVIYLSTGMLRELSAELLAGGYAPETPAAIVYHASWEDEIVCRCTVATLAESAAEKGIQKTALICVGQALTLGNTRSKLYDRSFETEYRQSEP